MNGGVPDYCALRPLRDLYTNEELSELDFTLMTFNVLAQSKVSREDYPYAAKKTLKWTHRREFLSAEIKAYDSDICCFQELDRLEHFAPFLRSLNYQLHIVERHTDCNCIAWKKDRFRKIHSHSVSLAETTQNAFGEATPNVLALVALQSIIRPEYVVVVATSHFYWRPECHEVRLQQMKTMLSHVEFFSHEVYRRHPSIKLVDSRWNHADLRNQLITTSSAVAMMDPNLLSNDNHQMTSSLSSPIRDFVGHDRSLSNTPLPVRDEDFAVNVGPYDSSRGVLLDQQHKSKDPLYDRVAFSDPSQEAIAPPKILFPILAGDFNSSRQCPSIKFALQYDNGYFRDAMEEYTKVDPSPRGMETSTVAIGPAYTSYCLYHVVLDHILYGMHGEQQSTDRINVALDDQTTTPPRLLPKAIRILPDHDTVVTSEGALPNSIYASDHFALQVKFSIAN